MCVQHVHFALPSLRDSVSPNENSDETITTDTDNTVPSIPLIDLGDF